MTRNKKEPFLDYHQIHKEKKKLKTFKSDFYQMNSIFGNDWAVFYALIGGRGVGKSYAAMRWAVLNKIRKGDKMKFYWFRLTDAAVKNLLADGADKLIDPDIKRKYDLKVTTNNTTVYTYKEKKTIVKHKDGTTSEKITKTNMTQFCEVLSCSTFYNTKGVGYFDKDYEGQYVLILDEMNREQSEKNNFDIVYNFANLIENLVRTTHINIKVIMIGNTLDEASDILSAFNFIPDELGRYKLKKKKCVIDYIRPNEAYLERQKSSLANILLPNASTFTNEIKIDRSLLVNKRKCKTPMTIIKFSKDKADWFTIYNGNIIKNYNNETKPGVAMRRYIDDVFNQQAVKNIFEQWDARAFRFANLATLKRFQKQLKLLKK